MIALWSGKNRKESDWNPCDKWGDTRMVDWRGLGPKSVDGYARDAHGNLGETRGTLQFILVGPSESKTLRLVWFWDYVSLPPPSRELSTTCP
jgi:hypothetical protein